MVKQRDALIGWSLACVLITLAGWFWISTKTVYEGTNIEFSFHTEEAFAISGTVKFSAIAVKPFILLGSSGQVIESRYSRQLQSNGADSHVFKEATVLSDTFKLYEGMRILSQKIYVQVKSESPVKVTVYDDQITWLMKYTALFGGMIVVTLIGYRLINHFSRNWYLEAAQE